MTPEHWSPLRRRSLLVTLPLLITMPLHAQSTTEADILKLSSDKFRWKTQGQIDRVADLFDDQLIFVHLNGHITTKADWIQQLRSRSFVYNTIDLHEASAKVYGDTAVLVGKASFNVSMGGSRGNTYRLVYTEVYTRKNGAWKLVNLHTTSG